MYVSQFTGERNITWISRAMYRVRMYLVSSASSLFAP